MANSGYQYLVHQQAVEFQDSQKKISCTTIYRKSQVMSEATTVSTHYLHGRGSPAFEPFFVRGQTVAVVGGPFHNHLPSHITNVTL